MSDTTSERVGPALAALQQHWLTQADKARAIRTSGMRIPQRGAIALLEQELTQRECADALTPLIARVTQLEELLNASGAELTNARLRVSDWHACSSPEELARWRGDIANLIITSKASVYPEVQAAEAALAASEARVQACEAAFADVGIVTRNDRLDWKFIPGLVEVSSSGADAGRRLAGLLRQVGYVVDGQHRKQLESDAARQQAEQERDQLQENLNRALKLMG